MTTREPTDAMVEAQQQSSAFEEWARLPILNLNLEAFPALEKQIGGGMTYRDPTTEIAHAAWFAGATSVKTCLSG